jgi:hypothetical protein
MEDLNNLSARVDCIYIGTYTKFSCYAFGGGYGVSYKGSTVEDYATLQEFAAAYNLVWG